MAITFDWINVLLLYDTPKQSEEGKFPVMSYQYCPETLRFQNIRISKIRWHLYTGGTYNPGFTVDGLFWSSSSALTASSTTTLDIDKPVHRNTKFSVT